MGLVRRLPPTHRGRTTAPLPDPRFAAHWRCPPPGRSIGRPGRVGGKRPLFRFAAFVPTRRYRQSTPSAPDGNLRVMWQWPSGGKGGGAGLEFGVSRSNRPGVEQRESSAPAEAFTDQSGRPHDVGCGFFASTAICRFRCPGPTPPATELGPYGLPSPPIPKVLEANSQPAEAETCWCSFVPAVLSDPASTQSRSEHVRKVGGTAPPLYVGAPFLVPRRRTIRRAGDRESPAVFPLNGSKSWETPKPMETGGPQGLVREGPRKVNQWDFGLGPSFFSILILRRT